MKILDETLEFLIRRHEQSCNYLHVAEENLANWKASDDVRVRGIQTRFWDMKVCEYENDCEILEKMIDELEVLIGD